MNIDDLIRGMTEEKYLTPLFILGLLISPAFMAILYFDKELFIRIDVIKLLLLSFAFAIPLVWMSYYLFGDLISLRGGIMSNIYQVIMLTAFGQINSIFLAYVLRASFQTFVIILVLSGFLEAISMIMAHLFTFIHYMPEDLKKTSAKIKIKEFYRSLKEFKEISRQNTKKARVATEKAKKSI